jgi:hypothetical protein
MLRGAHSEPSWSSPGTSQEEGAASPDSLTLWPTHEDGTPYRWAELNPAQQRWAYSLGLKALLREYAIADQAKRDRCQSW